MKKSKKKSVVEALRSVKRIVKDEYMLNLFESNQGSFNNLKKANNKFDVIFMGIQMKVIIWIVLIAISIIMFVYFRYKDVVWWLSITASLLLTLLLKYSLELHAYFLLKKSKEANK